MAIALYQCTNVCYHNGRYYNLGDTASFDPEDKVTAASGILEHFAPVIATASVASDTVAQTEPTTASVAATSSTGKTEEAPEPAKPAAPAVAPQEKPLAPQPAAEKLPEAPEPVKSEEPKAAPVEPKRDSIH